MSKQTRVSHLLYSLLPTDVQGFDSLAELALDMRCSWNHAADQVWRLMKGLFFDRSAVVLVGAKHSVDRYWCIDPVLARMLRPYKNMHRTTKE